MIIKSEQDIGFNIITKLDINNRFFVKIIEVVNITINVDFF